MDNDRIDWRYIPPAELPPAVTKALIAALPYALFILGLFIGAGLIGFPAAC